MFLQVLPLLVPRELTKPRAMTGSVGMLSTYSMPQHPTYLFVVRISPYSRVKAIKVSKRCVKMYSVKMKCQNPVSKRQVSKCTVSKCIV